MSNGGLNFQNAGFGSLNPVGSGGGTSSIMSLLAGLGGSTGFWPAMGLSAGGSLLGGLAGLFRGKSDSQKRSQQVFNLAQNRLGQSVLEPQQYLAEYLRSMVPMFNRDAGMVSKRLGLDSGAAWGEILRNQQSAKSGALADVMKFNANAMTARDTNLLQLMGQLSQNV